jgi:hypothetical protein
MQPPVTANQVNPGICAMPPTERSFQWLGGDLASSLLLVGLAALVIIRYPGLCKRRSVQEWVYGFFYCGRSQL